MSASKQTQDALIEVCADSIAYMETLRHLYRCLKADVSREHCLLEIEQVFEKTGGKIT